ncbi:MAG: low molecular weight phosphotyrosine protein phosphatase [Planctomycetaceae bacterium]|nr:MAG: low molecular weight phosphotyrosine protein phosphatase [Planctomycetaceae bacterium]
MKRSVLFVCLGNICRSPAAEAVLRTAAGDAAVEVRIDSAGTIAAHAGEPADPRMRAAGRKRGHALTSIARQVTVADLEPGRFDRVIAMDRENLAELRRLAPQPATRISLLSEFLESPWPQDVPDPYYGGADGFEFVLDMLEAAAPKILHSLSNLQD